MEIKLTLERRCSLLLPKNSPSPNQNKHTRLNNYLALILSFDSTSKSSSKLISPLLSQIPFYPLFVKMTSHPEFGASTTATEVASTFSSQITGKTGTSPYPSLRTDPITLTTLSSSRRRKPQKHRRIHRYLHRCSLSRAPHSRLPNPLQHRSRHLSY